MIRQRLRAAALSRGTAAVVLLAALGACSTTSARPDAGFDLVLRGGTVLDGSGAPAYRADVAVRDGRIAAVGDLSDAHAGEVLDVTGLMIAPGFINLHSHATPAGLRTAGNVLLQGVTTEILNADGAGPLDIEQQLSALEAAGLAVNVGANIGFNTAWAEVIGAVDRRPSADQIARVTALLAAGLEAGAWGVSAGLDYKPAYFAQTDEVVRVLEPLRRFGTVFTNHDRVGPESGYSSIAGMLETIAIGERSGLDPVITHMKVQGHEQGMAAVILDSMHAAIARGVRVSADVYPYLAGQTSLAALIIPGWAQDGGVARMRERFADPATRARIVEEAEAAMAARFGGAAGVYLPASRRLLTDVMKEYDVRAGEAVVRLLEQGNQTAILYFGSEADLAAIMKFPTAAIACDCGAAESAVHPRFFGTYPRVLGRYVREQRVLDRADAVRRMTALPARIIGMEDRGRIAAGLAADIVVFDGASIIDHATWESPTAPSAGIRHVLVNGQYAVRDGALTGLRAGRGLRRSTATRN